MVAGTKQSNPRTAWIYFGSDLSGQLSRTGLDHASHLLMEEFEVGKSEAWPQGSKGWRLPQGSQGKWKVAHGKYRGNCHEIGWAWISSLFHCCFFQSESWYSKILISKRCLTWQCLEAMTLCGLNAQENHLGLAAQERLTARHLGGKRPLRDGFVRILAVALLQVSFFYGL